MKKLACMLFVGVLSLQSVMTVQATTVSEAKEEKREAEKKLDSVNNSIDALESTKQETQSYIQKLDTDLVDLLVDIGILKSDLESKQVELDACKVELEAAKAEEAQQYEDMKKRIRFMYENGDSTLMVAFLESESITDLLNKVEYVGKIYEYDRNLLTEYQAAKEAVVNLETQLKNEKSEMQEMQSEYERQEADLATSIAKKKDEVNGFDAQLAEAKVQAQQYQEEIQAQTEAIRAEEQRAAAAAAAQAQAVVDNNQPANNSNGTTNQTNSNASTGSGNGAAVVAYASRFIGNPYVWGGDSLTNGADCSGFVVQVYLNFGVNLTGSRQSALLRNVGREVSYADAQPGDIVCYSGHVAIYSGNGGIVHAASAAQGITTGSATYRTILTIRRVI